MIWLFDWLIYSINIYIYTPYIYIYICIYIYTPYIYMYIYIYQGCVCVILNSWHSSFSVTPTSPAAQRPAEPSCAVRNSNSSTKHSANLEKYGNNMEKSWENRMLYGKSEKIIYKEIYIYLNISYLVTSWIIPQIVSVFLPRDDPPSWTSIPVLKPSHNCGYSMNLTRV